MAKIYNIFISHSWSYGDAYERLVDLLNSHPTFLFNDYSIPKYDPVHVGSDRQLEEAIYNKMRPCHIVLIMAGVYATYSRWINKEIRIARRRFLNPKPIIAVKPRGNVNVSSIVAENAKVIVGWNTESIVTAIRAYAI